MFLIILVGLLIVVPSCRQETVPEAPAAAVTKPSGKVSGDLIALQQEYAARRQAGTEKFVPSNSAVRLIGERVVIDAVAVGDGAALAHDLKGIGASDIAVSGLTVSAQLPIGAILDLEALESLKSVRASYGQNR